MKTPGIYKIINIKNGNLYIGSSVDIKRRIRTHRYHLNRGSHHSNHLQKAWALYGAESFSFEIVEKTTLDALILREQFWLENLKPQYNECPVAGNRLGYKHKEQTKKKLSEKFKGRIIPDSVRKQISSSLKGIPMSQETKDKLSKALSGKKRNVSEEVKKKQTERLRPYMKGPVPGFKHTEKTKQKLSMMKTGTKQSDATKRKRAQALHIPIVQLDKSGQTFIRNWDSVKEAASTLQISRSLISGVLTGVKKSAGGFIFKYKTDTNNV